MNRSEITAILAAAGLRPQHKFGQNFMIDQNILKAIADAGDIQPDDVILEVGPGVGNLTRLLASRAAHVLAVDIDKKLLPAAQRHHAHLTNVTWLIADVLAGKHEINPAVLTALRDLRARHPKGALKLVSNLPYNAASPIIAELLVMMSRERVSSPLLFERFAFTVQLEVAQRMAAKPDTSDYGPLGILIQLSAAVQLVKKIAPNCFWPPPKVHSSIVKILPKSLEMQKNGNLLPLQGLLSGVFSHRRQTLHNALKHHLGEAYTAAVRAAVESAGIDLKLRPEALALQDFITLCELVPYSGTAHA